LRPVGPGFSAGAAAELLGRYPLLQSAARQQCRFFFS
jgi:hypothetical protein